MVINFFIQNSRLLKITTGFRSYVTHFHFDFASKDVWKLFYNSTPTSEPLIGENIDTNITNGEYFIFKCTFIGISERSSIFFESHQVKYLISDSLFKNCSSRNNGGAICFQDSGSFVHHRVCAFKSNTYNFLGHHSYIQLRGNSNDLNYHYESSYYKCGNLENSYTNILTYGIIQVKLINTSFSLAEANSGISIAESTSIGLAIYSTFFCLIAHRKSIGLYFGDCNIKFCNVLNNTITHDESFTIADDESLIHTDESFTIYTLDAMVLIEKCSFLGNKAFYEFGSVSNSTIVINDTFCDNIITEGLVILNNVYNMYSIHKIFHFSSYMCKAKYPGSTGNSRQFLQYRIRTRA